MKIHDFQPFLLRNTPLPIPHGLIIVSNRECGVTGEWVVISAISAGFRISGFRAYFMDCTSKASRVPVP